MQRFRQIMYFYLNLLSVYQRYIVMAFLLRPTANYDAVEHHERRAGRAKDLKNAQDAASHAAPKSYNSF